MSPLPAVPPSRPARLVPLARRRRPALPAARSPVTWRPRLACSDNDCPACAVQACGSSASPGGRPDSDAWPEREVLPRGPGGWCGPAQAGSDQDAEWRVHFAAAACPPRPPSPPLPSPSRCAMAPSPSLPRRKRRPACSAAGTCVRPRVCRLAGLMRLSVRPALARLAGPRRVACLVHGEAGLPRLRDTWLGGGTGPRVRGLCTGWPAPQPPVSGGRLCTYSRLSSLQN